MGMSLPVIGVPGLFGGAFIYLLRDDFLTAEAAPLSSPRTCEPGPGTLTLVQTDGEFSISGSELNFPAQATAAWGDQGLWGAAIARSVGVAVYATWNIEDTTKYNTVGFDDNQTSEIASTEGRYWSRLGDLVPHQLTAFDAMANSTTYHLVIVLRSTGAFYIVKGGAYSDWTLYYVADTGSTATLYPGMSNYEAGGTLGTLRVARFPGKDSDATPGNSYDNAFGSDYGIATNRIATTSDNSTTTSEADAWIEHTITAATGVTQELSTRRTDDNNRWIVEMDQTNSTCDLIEMNASTPTTRSTTAQTWTDAADYRVAVIQAGTDIQTLVDTDVKNTYASATFNQTATGVKVSHAGSNLVTWPRYIDPAQSPNTPNVAEAKRALDALAK